MHPLLVRAAETSAAVARSSAARCSSPTSPCGSPMTTVARRVALRGAGIGPHRCAPTSTGWWSSRSRPSGGGGRYSAPAPRALIAPAASRAPYRPARPRLGWCSQNEPHGCRPSMPRSSRSRATAHMHVGWVAVFSAPAEGSPAELLGAPRQHRAAARACAPLSPEARLRAARAARPGVDRRCRLLGRSSRLLGARPARRTSSMRSCRCRCGVTGRCGRCGSARSSEDQAVCDHRQGPPLHGRRSRCCRARLAAARPYARAAPRRARGLAGRSQSPSRGAPAGRAWRAGPARRAARPAATGRCGLSSSPARAAREAAAGAVRVTRALGGLLRAAPASAAQRPAFTAAAAGLDPAPARGPAARSSVPTAQPSTT